MSRRLAISICSENPEYRLEMRQYRDSTLYWNIIKHTQGLFGSYDEIIFHSTDANEVAKRLSSLGREHQRSTQDANQSLKSS